jgi:hypothetical protein
MKKNIIFYVFLVIGSIIFIIGCKKDFLDKKSATNLNVPTTLYDLQLLLDNTDDLYKSPALGELSSDDYYLTSNTWTNQALPYFANCYVWAKDIFAGNGDIKDWNLPYSQVLYANIVLQQLAKIDRNNSNAQTFDNLKANALFLRAWAFFHLAQIFSLPFDHNTATSDQGIALRLTADVNVPTTRASVKATYDQILSDLSQSRSLITNPTSILNQNRASKASIFGLFSRVYLTMREYQSAGLYADSALKLHSKLINYNNVDSNARTPFSLSNDETIFQNTLVPADPLSFILNSQGYSIDTSLYKLYDKNDLRRTIYFKKNGVFINKRRGYSGQTALSNGIATDELYLTRAEWYARSSRYNQALADINTLMMNRWLSGTYIPVSNIQGSELLKFIITERRKELVFRGLRWLDIRRLNKEGYNIILTRNLDGKIYTLPPNDIRYAMPIPPDVITQSGIKQNDR